MNVQDQYLKVVKKLDHIEYMLYVVNFIMFAFAGFMLGYIL